MIDHLFRREAARLLAALTRTFGVHNLPLAEDVVQDALLRALETWKIHGVPENPGAWLMQVAKNRALDVVRRERRSESLDGDDADSEPTAVEPVALEPAPDDELRMMFSCCHPKVPEEAQVALILSVLSGFGVAEIASAFLAKESAIEKRLARAKTALAETRHLFDFAEGGAGATAISDRLASVQKALYLLFNEGYHGANDTHAVRIELCREAMHLVSLLRQNAITATRRTTASATRSPRSPHCRISSFTRSAPNSTPWARRARRPTSKAATAATSSPAARASSTSTAKTSPPRCSRAHARCSHSP